MPVGPVSFALKEKGDLGTILVDVTGYTVYAFDREPDDQPASARTVARRDGAQQATYKGHPLYLYAGDRNDKDANGQGLNLFGGEWHVLTKDGQPLA